MNSSRYLISDQRSQEIQDGVHLLRGWDGGAVLQHVLSDEDRQDFPAVEVEQPQQRGEVGQAEDRQDVVEAVDRDLEQLLQLTADRCQVFDPEIERYR